MNSGYYLQDSQENDIYKIIGVGIGGNIVLQDVKTDMFTVIAPQNLYGDLTLGIYFLTTFSNERQYYSSVPSLGDMFREMRFN